MVTCANNDESIRTFDIVQDLLKPRPRDSIAGFVQTLMRVDLLVLPARS